MSVSEHLPLENRVRVLVVGGTGFLGRLLANSLVDSGLCHVSFVVHRNTPTWMTEQPVSTIKLDLADGVALASAFRDVDVLVTMLRPDGKGWCREAMEFILPIAVKSGISRVVHLSSIDVYGMVSQILVDEETVPEPMTHYAMEHLAIEKLIRSSVSLPAILRLGAVFGEGGRNVISFASEAKHASRFRLSVRRALYGERRMHLVSAETVCGAIAAMTTKPERAVADAIVLVTDDCDERNNFSFLQDRLVKSAGRAALRNRFALPGIFLRILLKIKGQPAAISTRRYSGERLKKIVDRQPDFGVTLERYIAHLFSERS